MKSGIEQPMRQATAKLVQPTKQKQQQKNFFI